MGNEWQAVPEVLGAVKRAVDVDQLVTRDAQYLEGPRDPAKLRRYFEAFALNSAGIVEDKTLFEAAGLNRKTAVAYEQLFINLLVIERIPPWTSKRLKRLIRSPKRYLIDPALLVGILGLDANAVIRDGDLLGQRFVKGLVLHTGSRAYQLGERIHAVPISTLWRAPM